MPHKNKEEAALYRDRTRKQRNARRRAHWKANRERLLQKLRERTPVIRYGITLKEVETLKRKQKGLCALCRRPPGPRGLCIDHDHERNRVRGLLCSPCNVALGSLGDNAEGLRRALMYVLGRL